MITEYHFPTQVYIKDIPNAVQLNQYLEPRIIQWSQQDKGVSKTNAGGWHSTTDMNRRREYDPLTKELFSMQEEVYQKQYLDLKPVLGNMWANINYPGNFNRTHLHPNALFSGVYWIKASQVFWLYSSRNCSSCSLLSRLGQFHFLQFESCHQC